MRVCALFLSVILSLAATFILPVIAADQPKCPAKITALRHMIGISGGCVEPNGRTLCGWHSFGPKGAQEYPGLKPYPSLEGDCRIYYTNQPGYTEGWYRAFCREVRPWLTKPRKYTDMTHHGQGYQLTETATGNPLANWINMRARYTTCRKIN